jgi:hypothetical protein
VSQAECRCGRPIHDTAYACHGCGRTLARALAQAALLAADIETTVARLSRGIGHGPGLPDEDGWERNADALEPIPLPLYPPAVVGRDAVLTELETWARHVSTQRGLPHPLPGAGQPLATLALWLAGQVEWLRYQPEADEAMVGLRDACAQVRHIVDRRPTERIAGPCPGCGTALYALEEAATVRCEACEADHSVAELRRRLVSHGRDFRVTASEAARLVIVVDPLANRDRARKLIWAWADRGHIQADPDGRYELGLILDRWTRALAARVA